jgi:hypothetical protein
MLAAAGAAQAQGIQFSHPELKARRIPVGEYQAIGKTHDAACQAQALEAATRRFPIAATPPVVASDEEAKRDAARAQLVGEGYVKCMEGKGWVRLAR